MHQYGYGADRDRKTALRFFKKASNLGHAQAFTKCGDFHYSSGDNTSALACYKRAAELGDVSSLNNIGLIYEQGFGTTGP